MARDTTLLSADHVDFVNGYIECALWCGVSGTDEAGEHTIVHDLDDDMMTDGLRAEIESECADFVAGHFLDLLAYVEECEHGWSGAGHDFHLTRNRHGAGFWDRGLGELGRRLTDAAHVYGETNYWVDDEGVIHQG